MADDFDIDRLAAYLHLTPAQVAKMANRGNLPGRKIGGDWIFTEAEIHHWLEERIGISDDSELREVEDVLERSAASQEEDVSIADWMPLEAVEVPLSARSRSSVIVAMSELAARTGLLWDPGKMAEAVRARESLHPTALENGVALLHPRRPLTNILAQPLLALGRTHQGVPFGGARGRLTDVFFLICSTDDSGHLRMLARLTRLLSDDQALGDLREAENSAEAHEAMIRAEQRLFS